MNKNKMDEIYSFLGVVGDLNELDWADSGSCLMLWD